MTRPDVEVQWLREGLAPWPSQSAFISAAARMFYKPQGEHPAFRVAVVSAHCNGLGITHGGFIATMPDTWLACNVAHKDARFVTASLNVNYPRNTPAGTWFESEIGRVKLGSRLCHASGAILSDGRPVTAMRAVFALPNESA